MFSWTEPLFSLFMHISFHLLLCNLLIYVTLLSTGTLPVSTSVFPDASPLPISSPVIMSVDSRSRNDADQSHSQSKSKKRALPAKRRASALSAASPGSVRRSPRFPVTVSSLLDIFPRLMIMQRNIRICKMYVRWNPQTTTLFLYCVFFL